MYYNSSKYTLQIIDIKSYSKLPKSIRKLHSSSLFGIDIVGPVVADNRIVVASQILQCVPLVELCVYIFGVDLNGLVVTENCVVVAFEIIQC